jgi:hypothetical protein
VVSLYDQAGCVLEEILDGGGSQTEIVCESNLLTVLPCNCKRKRFGSVVIGATCRYGEGANGHRLLRADRDSSDIVEPAAQGS